MAALPNDLALTVINDGSQIVAADHRNNYATIQAAVNAIRDALAGGTSGQVVTVVDSTHIALALLVNANVDPAAAIAYSKLNLTGHIALTDLVATLAAVAQTTPANPTGNASGTAKMMGLSSGTTIITPTTTRLFVSVSGLISAGGSTTCAAHLRYGTGNGPANAAATTGTVVGNTNGIAPVTAAGGVVPFTLSGVVTGLTAGVAVWVDLDVASGGGGTTAVVTNLTVVTHDIV